jgi:ATP-dependent Lon protease
MVVVTRSSSKRKRKASSEHSKKIKPNDNGDDEDEWIIGEEKTQDQTEIDQDLSQINVEIDGGEDEGALCGEEEDKSDEDDEDDENSNESEEEDENSDESDEENSDELTEDEDEDDELRSVDNDTDELTEDEDEDDELRSVDNDTDELAEDYDHEYDMIMDEIESILDSNERRKYATKWYKCLETFEATNAVTIQTILDTPMSQDHKQHIIELYEIYKVSPLSEERITLRNKIKTLLKQYAGEHQYLSSHEQLQDNANVFDELYDEHDHYSLKIKILQTPMAKKDRLKIVELYKIFQNQEPNSTEKIDIKDKLLRTMKQYHHEYQYRQSLNADALSKIDQEYHHVKHDLQLKVFKSKIFQLNTTIQNKSFIYKHYEELQQLDKDNEEYAKTKKWLDQALSLPFDHIEPSKITDPQFLATLVNEEEDFGDEKHREDQQQQQQQQQQQKQLDNGLDLLAEVATNRDVLPVQPSTPDIQKYSNAIICYVLKQLDERMYGLNHVKEQIAVYFNTIICNPSIKGCCLGLIGPPGVGKTFLAESLSDILGMKFSRMSFGNRRSDIRGHDFTYIGSHPGSISRSLIQMGCKNGILFMDEFEKVKDNEDIINTLLEITDFTTNRNSRFKDDYFVELVQDLSHLWFIVSMNDFPSNSALKNRIFPIHIPGYTIVEKVRIVLDHIIPRFLKSLNLPPDCITMSEKVARHFINLVVDRDHYEKGVRKIKEMMHDIIRKIQFIISTQLDDGSHGSLQTSFMMNQLSYPVKITEEMINKLIMKKQKDEPLSMYL